MKRIIVVFAAVLSLAFAWSDAQAASRMGGGRSSGIQRNNVMQNQAAPAQAPSQAAAAKPAQAAPAAPAAAPVPPQPAPTGMSRWLGPLAGLAVGAGLASMFMGGGMGAGGGMGGLLMVVLLAAAAFFLYSTLRRRNASQAPLAQAPMQFGGELAAAPAAVSMPMPPSPLNAAPGPGALQTPAAPALASAIALPAGFDSAGFLRQAKLNFMRLQAANDRKDLHDIRNFTTPEMFAEISLQAQERGPEPQQIDVTELNAELLDVTEGADEHLASVRFFGALREGQDVPPEAFDEVWHLAKPASGQSGWLIAGIQQFA